MARIARIPEETVADQRRASDPRLSAWVAANAGAGKTHVLSQRVMRLLLSGTEPSRILCLTYTRAAAANMADRVFRNLARWTMLPDDALREEIAAFDGRAVGPDRLARARRLFAQALETPGGLKIQTIHAFCEAVLHQFPLEANIAGHFELLDSRMEAALVAEASRELIGGAAARTRPELGEAFAVALDRGGEAGLDALLREIVARRDSLRRFIAALPDTTPRFGAIDDVLGVKPGDSEAAIAASIWPDPYFDLRLAQDMAARAASAGKATAADFAGGLAELCKPADPVATLDRLRAHFMTKPSGGDWKPKSLKNVLAKGVAEHFPAFADEHARFCAAMEQACDGIARWRMARDTRAALVVADWLVARYERLKSARGFLDFNDLIERTGSLLARADAGAWVQYKLDKGIDHVLLDEAQDTSPEQWRVVRALAGEFFAGDGTRDGGQRTVFAVGDEKQSIYSFQGADPESFDLSGRAFEDAASAAEIAFARLKLRHSFRSVEDVLVAVDRVFSDQRRRKGLTRDDEPIAHLALREAQHGHVDLWPSLGVTTVEEPDDWLEPVDHASAPAVRLARTIAGTIRHWLDTGERIEGQDRALTPGDVLVLVRKRDAFIHALNRELKDQKIDVAGADRLLLTDHIAVKDLMAIARVTLQRHDDLSLAALLRSPIFGISDDALTALAAYRPSGQPLIEALRVSARDDGEISAIVHLLDRWHGEADRAGLFSFFANVLARDGARRRLVARLGHEAGDVLDEFLSFCLASEKTGVTGLEAFLALLDTDAPEIKRELDQSRGQVRIMTAHAAKGLEAPVVFLVDPGSAPFSDSHLPRLMPFSYRGDGPPVTGRLWRAGADSANTFSRALADEARAKAEDEYRRLLYVAMTRAEDRLIVCGYHGKRTPSPDRWHALVEEALAGAPETMELTHPVTGEPVLRFRAGPPPASSPRVEPFAAPEPPAPVTLPEALTTPLPPEPRLPRPLAPSGAAGLVEPTLAEAPRLSPILGSAALPSVAIRRGTAAHRLLQELPDLDVSQREAAARRYLSRVASDWPEGEGSALLERVMAILSDPGHAALFAPGSRAEVEIAGRLRIGGEPRSIAGKIDRLAFSDGQVLIVDYKTSRPAPATLDEVPEGHVAQLALYRELVRPLYPHMPVRAALLYTERPRLIDLPHTALDDALARLGTA